MIVVASLALQALSLSLSTPGGEPPTQPKLNAMSDQCHTPHNWLKYRGGRAINVQTPPDAEFEQTECLLRQLKTSALDFDLSFIGNEAVPIKARAH